MLAATGDPDGLVCLSVRSAFDLLLTVLDVRPGDEIVFSGITHPDMPRIAEAHGATVVAADLNLETLAVAELPVTARTRAIVVAHLFGARVPLEPLRRDGVLLVEDCAQSLLDAGAARTAAADVSLYSFGTIKTATALGGAIVRTRDPALRRRMHDAQAAWPLQRERSYRSRLAKTALLRLASHPVVYGWVSATVDVDRLARRAVRGFGDDVLTAVRRRPSEPLLALLERRLRRFDPRRLERRRAIGERLAAAAGSPGLRAPVRTHWVVPVCVADRDAFVARLRAGGFDATPATSGIAAVSAAPRAARFMREVVFVPCYPELADDEVARLAGTLRELLRSEP